MKPTHDTRLLSGESLRKRYAGRENASEAIRGRRLNEDDYLAKVTGSYRGHGLSRGTGI